MKKPHHRDADAGVIGGFCDRVIWRLTHVSWIGFYEYGSMA